MASCLFGCSSDNDESITKDIGARSEITVEHLCSVYFWVDINETQTSKRQYYNFQRIYKDCEGYTGVGDIFPKDSKHSKGYTFVVSAPYVHLTYKDGSTERLEVYAVSKGNSNQKYITINGKEYTGVFPGTDVH